MDYESYKLERGIYIWGAIKVTLDGLAGCAMQFHTVAITLEDLKSSMDNVFGSSVDSKIKRRRNIDGSIADIQKSMKALYTEIENISLFVSSSKDIYDKTETRLSRESQFNPFYNSIPNSYYGVWWNGIPITNKDVGEAVQGRGEMPNPVPALMAWYQDLEKGTKVFFGNVRQVVEGIGCGAVDAAKELVYGVADIGKFVYNLGFGLSEFMMDDPFGKSEAWIKQNGSTELKNFIRLKWGGELLPKLWDLSQNKFIESKDKFTKADLKTKSAMATDTVVNLLLIFVPASKISKIGKSAEVVEGLSKFEKGAETVSKISLAEKEVKAVEGISKVEKEAKVVEGLTKANRSVREAEKVAEGVGKGINNISSSVDYYIGPNGKALLSQYKNWIGINIQKELLNQAENPQLQDAIKQLYRGKSFIGNGGTADVIRFEEKTGIMLGKKGGSHIQKGIDMASYIENKILKQTLSTSDRALAEKLLDDLNKALGR